MNPNDILIRVQRQFGDQAGVQIEDGDVIRWINDAQHEAVMQHDNLLQEYADFDSEAGEQLIVLPDNLLDIQAIYSKYDTSNLIQLKYYPTHQMDEYFPGWRQEFTLGSPQVYTRGDTEKRAYIYPVPSLTVTNAYHIVYSRYAVDITALGDPIDLPEYYHPYVLEFCMMKAYEMDEDYAAADRKAAYVQSTIDFNSGREATFSKEVYPSVTPSMEDYM